MKIFIGIVQFNKSCFLREQVNRIDRYLLRAKNDKITISIADNSTNAEDHKVNEFICKELNLFYMGCDFKEGDPSLHHALALNELYNKSINEENDFSLFFDHDTFMFAPSNIIYESREKHFAGIGQAKIGMVYLHPNCLLLNNKFVPREVVDMTPCQEMDTGGRLAKYISELKASDINHLSFEYVNFHYDGINDVYEMLGDSFFHMIKGSNWNNNPKWKQREEVLLQELQKISK